MSGTTRSPLRWSAAALLLVVAAVHLPLVPEHLEEAPYAGVLFVALAVVSVVLAVLLVYTDSALVWSLSGVVTLLALVAFLATRTVGLPQLGDDVGDWSEPLGFPALAAEAMVAALAAFALIRPRR